MTDLRHRCGRPLRGQIRWIVTVVLLSPAVAWAQLWLLPPSQPLADPLTARCKDEAQRLLSDPSSLHDGRHKALPELPKDERDALMARPGVAFSWLSMTSMITPPSVSQLMLVPDAQAAAAADADCPLHRIYLVFRQGGYAPQPPKVYGPLKQRAD